MVAGRASLVTISLAFVPPEAFPSTPATTLPMPRAGLG